MVYFILVIKIVIIIFFALACRATLPRYRFDQLTQLNWKHFIFIWLGFLIFNYSFLIIFF